MDLDFRRRLLDYIESIASECLPQDVDGEWMDMDENLNADDELYVNNNSADRVFQPFPDPDDPDFDTLMQRDVFHIVHVRQIHSRKHNPCCFKYGSKRCRFHFPRKVLLQTTFDEDTGVVYIKRNHGYVNNFNKWFSIITRGNHDIQFLYTKNHALAIVHYIMKYISKPEAPLHSKLTVAAAVRQTMSTSTERGSYADIAKKMLLKVYNKLDSLREVGIPEAISHLLKFPDHYTDAKFVNIHTTHLLRHIQTLDRHDVIVYDRNENDFNSQIIVKDDGFCTVSPYDDYAYRGDTLQGYCLYDYCAQFYKHKRLSGLLFDSPHPQYEHYSQFLRNDSLTVPTLLGTLLFVIPYSSDEKKKDDYYCLIASLFFPWSQKRTPKASDESWEHFVEAHQNDLSSRLQRIIYNLTLLHKTKEETRIHHLQMRLQEQSSDSDGDDFHSNSSVVSDYSVYTHGDFSSAVDQVLSLPIELGLDLYTSEGLDAYRDNAHVTAIS